MKHKKSVILTILLLAGSLLAACQGAVQGSPTAVPPGSTEMAEVPGTATPVEKAPTPTDEPPRSAAPRPSTAAPAAEAGPINDEEAQALMAALLNDGSEARQARERIVAAGDERFTAVFIELIRGRQLGLVDSDLSYDDYLAAIADISGEAPGDDWFELIEWYGQTDLEPPPGFTSWKGEMLSLIDDEFGQFLSDEHPSTIRVEEIQWGGVRRLFCL